MLKRLLLAIILFAVCGDVKSKEDATRLISSNPLAQYELLKKLLEEPIGKSPSALSIRHYDLDCPPPREGFEQIPDSPLEGYGNYDLVIALYRVAYKRVRWTFDLDGLGYPHELWASLSGVFDLQVERILRDAAAPDGRKAYSLYLIEEIFSGSLAVVLNEYRKSHTTLPAITSGCPFASSPAPPSPGVGSPRIQIRTDPNDGRAFYIPVFFYKLCKEQNLDADDVVQCDLWREALEDKRYYLMGDYEYQVRWPDGVVRQGVLQMSDVMDGVLVIRKIKQ
jgi:hypothetical protein